MKAKLGSGKRFASVQQHVEKEGYTAKAAAAVAAGIGRKKYGSAKMSKLSAKGRC